MCYSSLNLNLFKCEELANNYWPRCSSYSRSLYSTDQCGLICFYEEISLTLYNHSRGNGANSSS